jgi:hypothetical protein
MRRREIEKIVSTRKGNNMKATITRFAMIGLLSLGICGSGFAQQERQKPTDDDKDKTAGKEMMVTGCLQKGDEANEYSIKDADGKMYDLRSTSVKLENHLNHKVTVTGKMMNEENAKEKKEGRDHLNVTNVKMISTSCQ